MKSEMIGIYGCGECGIQIYLLLRENGIDIDFFGDLDNKKEGYVIEGILCRSYNEILQLAKEHVLLVVAVAHRRDLCIKFQKSGFQRVVYYDDIKKEIYSKIGKNNLLRSDLTNIDEIKKMKESIENVLFREDLSIYEKRNSILNLLEE